jgi:hypothetical protein
LSLKENYGSGNWCVVGDFNSVVEPEERRGERSDVSLTSEMRAFHGFIDDLDLIDLPLLGRRFTWFHANGRLMSRIDRMLVSPDWLDRWGVSSV